MKKTNTALKVHISSGGAVKSFSENKKPSEPPKKNLRDVVGATQSPSIRDVFTKRTK